MEIAYSREAMHSLLSLDAAEREKAIAAAEQLAMPGPLSGREIDQLLEIADGSDFRLAPFTEFADLVVTRNDDKLIVLALIDVIGALKGTPDQ